MHHALIERSAPHSPVAVRDVAQEMADIILENPGYTEQELMKHGNFFPRQMERFLPDALAIVAKKQIKRI